LAIFTSVELRLTTLPGAVAGVMGVFASLAAATEAAIRARECGAVACEMLDKTFLDFVASATGTPFAPTTEAILLTDVEGPTPDDATANAASVVDGFERAGATETRIAVDHDERERLWSLRHAASPTLARLSDRLRSM